MAKISSSRASRTAATWLQKAVRHLQYEEKKAIVPYEAQQLLDEVLNAAEELIPMLDYNDELSLYFIEESRKRLTAVSSQFRRELLRVKLANTEGRAPEEAELYRQKAEALNDQS